eukprot:s1325_g8.t3
MRSFLVYQPGLRTTFWFAKVGLSSCRPTYLDRRMPVHVTATARCFVQIRVIFLRDQRILSFKGSSHEKPFIRFYQCTRCDLQLETAGDVGFWLLFRRTMTVQCFVGPMTMIKIPGN